MIEEERAALDDSDANELRTFTIPEIMETKNANELLLVKIDIEGAEAALFRSHTEWLPLTRLVIIELHDWMLPGKRTSNLFIRSLASLDCELVHKGENLCVFLDERGPQRELGNSPLTV